MKRFTLRLVVALLTFIVGVAVATAWAIRRYQAPVKQQLSELQPMKPSPPSKVATNSEPPKVSLNELKMATKTVAEHEEGVYEIKASYPQIESLRTENVQRFNQWLKRFVLSDVEEFRGLETAAMKKHKGEKPPIEESLDISYDVILATENLISLKFTHSVMALGQMHPIDYPVPVNYDLKHSKQLELLDLFEPNANFLEAFSEYCSHELKKEYGDQFFLMAGTAAKAENYKNWNITPEGIMISFDDYQVGPHSMGQPVLIIPYSVLKDLMARNDGLLEP